MELKVPVWMQAMTLVMIVALVPMIGLTLDELVDRLPRLSPIRVGLVVWLLFVIGLQFTATFQKSPQTCKASMIALGMTGALQLFFFSVLVCYSGYMYNLSGLQRLITHSLFAYLPATVLLLFVMIGLNYLWLKRLVNTYGSEGPSRYPPVFTLSRMFGLIAFIAMVMGFMAAIQGA